jgi:hypothetical protein
MEFIVVFFIIVTLGMANAIFTPDNRQVHPH